MTDLENAIRATGLPLRYREIRPTGPPEWLERLSKVRDLLTNGTAILLHGERGRGKTQLAAELIREALEAGRTARYMELVDFFRALRDTFGTKEPSQKVIDQMVRPWLLVLDECHERSDTRWENIELTGVVSKRYNEERPTILISNLTREKLAEAFGPSAISRACHGGGAVELTGRDFRKEPMP